MFHFFAELLVDHGGEEVGVGLCAHEEPVLFDFPQPGDELVTLPVADLHKPLDVGQDCLVGLQGIQNSKESKFLLLASVLGCWARCSATMASNPAAT